MFYERINKIYKKFKIPRTKQTMEQYCKPKNFTLQPPQEFLANFINPDTPYKSILVYHRIGAGKTCAAIQIAEKWKNERKIIFVLPASLKGNLRTELRSLCGGDKYMKPSERKRLAQLNPKEDEYLELIRRSDERIDKYYTIYSYNKFIEHCKEGEMSLKNSLLIIDEIQNMVSDTGTYYTELKKLIEESSNNLRIILLSATPMFDKPMEIALTMNLMNLPKEIPVGREFEKKFISERIIDNKQYFTVKNMDYFKNLIKGFVSYYRGAPPFTFPVMNVRYIECEMSDFQYQVYRLIIKKENNGGFPIPTKEDIVDAADLPNNFYIGARFVSNVVYPNKKIGEMGFESFTPNKIRANLAKYSVKFDRIIKSLARTKGKAFIYSSFKEHAGLKSLVVVLEAMGYKNYIEHGAGRKRFAVWSGDESSETKDEIREVFNRKDNLYGTRLKIILGSPSIKEGVSLKAVRTVHVLEPYWNQSRLEQVVGRASRFCSHQDLPEDERNVRVYVYIATKNGTSENDNEITVDQYIKKLSDTKNKIIRQFEIAIKEAAVDCRLNKNANVYKGEDDLICM
jgi:superfamily II DNA or RNA helicase